MIPFALAIASAAIGVWRRSRVGYIAAVAVSGLVFALFSASPQHGVVDLFTNPANTIEFVGVVTVVPLSLGVLIYSILGLREVWRGAKSNVKPAAPVHTIPRSGVIVLVAIGFIVGGLSVGLLAGPTINRLIAGTGQGDITIVLNAGVETNPQFYAPATFQANVGQTVTWVNRDTQAHTVTSDTPLFDSGIMESGLTFKTTFTQPGTYTYHCSLHPWMKATVVVTG